MAQGDAEIVFRLRPGFAAARRVVCLLGGYTTQTAHNDLNVLLIGCA